MKRIIESVVAFIVALIGFIGGCFWLYYSGWEMEQIIVTSASFVEIVGFIVSRIFVASKSEETKNAESNPKMENKENQEITNKGEVKKQINIHSNSGNIKM